MKVSREHGNVFRMASFRLTVLGTLFSTIGAIVVFALIYTATLHAARILFMPIIAGERADLMADMAEDKLSLADEVRLSIKASPHTFYALTDREHKFVVGNIAIPHNPLGWQQLTRWDNINLPHSILEVDGFGEAVADGGILFIGEDGSAFAILNVHIAYLFAGVFGVTIGLGLLVSLVIAYYSLKRVQAISETSRDIMGGDLSRRIKLYGVDDEFDFLTADLNKMLATMENLVENARHVTSNIAHDLRSPLTRLRDYLEASRRAAASNPGGDAETVNVLTNALVRLDEIIGIFSALLRIAEIEAGAVRGNFTEIDISALCRSLVESYEFVAEDGGQVLTTDIDDAILMTGDIELITQMLVNVLENAICHCPPGVEMCLRAKMLDNVLTIEMADRGRGIAESERERVFRRFIRLEDARQTKGKGLGLSLVKAVVLLHNGTVSLHDNNPGLNVRMVFQKPH